jgi:hypothetical protein
MARPSRFGSVNELKRMNKTLSVTLAQRPTVELRLDRADRVIGGL